MTFRRILVLVPSLFLFGAALAPIPQTATNPTSLQAPLTAGGAMRKILQHVEYVEIDDGLGNMMPTIRFHGANVQIVNGSGTTDGPVDGLGNLIVGYNELRGVGDNRTGSHNLIVGSEHNVLSYGGLVAGERNEVSGVFATVSGGRSNTASGGRSSVSGGYGNAANATASSVSGGRIRFATGPDDWVAGSLFEDS